MANNNTALAFQIQDEPVIAHQRPALELAAQGTNGLASEQKARLSECVEAVENLLQQYQVDSLPGTLKEILNNPWKKLLVVLMLREGTDSERWAKAIHVMEQLVKCPTQGTSPAERYQLIANLPKLRSRLQEGFAYISFCSKTSNRMLNDFQMCCIKSMRG